MKHQRKFLRSTFAGLLVLLTGTTIFAQHNNELYNDGAEITVQAGAEVFVMGDVHMTQATGLLDNDGLVEVQGNMYGDNLFQQRGTGTVRLQNNDVNTSERQFIQGSYAVRGGQAQIGVNDGSFYDLELANTQGMVHLVGSGNIADVRNTVDFQPVAAGGPINRIITHDTTTVPSNGSGYSATFGMMNPAAGLGNFVNNTISINGNMSGSDNAYVQGNLRRAINPTGGTYGYVLGLEPGGVARGVQYILIDFAANNYDVISSYFEQGSPNVIPGTNIECGNLVNYFAGADHGEWMFADIQGTGTGPYEVRIWPQDGTYPTLVTYFVTKDDAILGTPNDCGPTEIGLDRAAFNGFNTPVSQFDFAGSTIIFDANEIEIAANPIRNKAIQIEWANTEEKGMVEYVLERGTDQGSMVEISRQSAVGNDNGRWSYREMDLDVIAGLDYFYRVYGIDQDGQQYSSNVVQARLDGSALADEIRIYPVPVGDQGLNLQIASAEDREFNLTIYNAIGQIVYKTDLNAPVGFNEFTIPTKDWSDGTYFIHFYSGNQSLVREVIRRR